MELPELKDWKDTLNRLIEKKGQSQEDLLEVIHQCHRALNDMRPAFDFVRGQHSDIEGWKTHYSQLYSFRFREDPPALSLSELSAQEFLETPESRKKVVREIALSLTSPGMDIGDNDVLNALQERRQQLVARNPVATISTILNGYKSHFEKVEGKRGVFRRRGLIEDRDDDP